MSRLSFHVACLDPGGENVQDTSLKSSIVKKGLGCNPRTPLMDIENMYTYQDRMDSVKMSETPRRKSAKKKREDLTVLAAQLKTSNLIQQEEIKKLESDLILKEMKCQKLQETTDNLEIKCAALEKSLQSSSSYYQQYRTAQELVLELYSEKREVDGLMADFEATSQLQLRMKDALLSATQKLMSLSNQDNRVTKLHENIASLQDEYYTCQQRLAISEEEKKVMRGDIKLMQSLLMQSNNSLSDLDEKWYSVNQEIKKRTEQIQQLERENTSVTQAFNIMMKEKIKAEDELSQSTAKMEIMMAKFEEEKEKMEVYIKNLQHTLDCWEVERDVADEEISSLRQEVLSHEKSEKEMSIGMSELKAMKADVMKYQAEIEELKTSNQFLEAEKDLYTSAITDYRLKLESELDLSKSNQELIASLKANNDELQCSFEQLQMDFNNAQEDTLYANERASTIARVLEHIHACVKKTVDNFQESFGVKLSSSLTGQTPHLRNTSKERSFVEEVLSRSAGSGYSLSKSLLCHGSLRKFPVSCSTGKKITIKRLRQDNVEYGSVHKKLQSHDAISSQARNQALSGSVASITETKVDSVHSRRRLQFDKSAPLQDEKERKEHLLSISQGAEESAACGEAERGTTSLCSNNEACVENQSSSPRYAIIRHIPSSSSKRMSSDEEGSGGFDLQDFNCDIIEQCEDLMDSIEDMLGVITRTGKVVNKASKLSVKDLNGEIDILQDKLTIKDKKIALLEKELRSKTKDAEQKEEELRNMKKRSNSMMETILKHEDLDLDVKRLEEEKEEWQLREEKMSGEITMLSQQLEEVIGKADANHGSTKDGTCLREIVALKKKNYNLEYKIYEEMQKNKQVSSTAMRRLKIVEENWKKAEAETKDLDEIIESIRMKCIESARHNPEFADIVRFIDGQGDSSLWESKSTRR